MALSGFQEIMTSRQFSHELGCGPNTFEDLTSSAHTAGTRPNAGTAKALLNWTFPCIRSSRLRQRQRQVRQLINGIAKLQDPGAKLSMT